jgi:hypothetical protein
MKPTVVILLSDKRSGSTMFENEICRHPDINHVAYTPHSYNETHYWLMSATLLKMPEQLFNGHRHPKNYGPYIATRRYIIDCIRGNVPDFVVPDSDEELVFAGWDALCLKFAGPVFFEKSPQHPHHWAALELMMKWAQKSEFTVRFIVLVRNPMAVMHSAYKLFATDPEERQFGWASCYRNLLAMREIVGRESFQMVRYEDLIAHPKLVFGEVCDYIGLDRCEAMGDKVHSGALEKWRDDLYFTLQLDESVRRLAGYFGYREEDVHNPPKPGMPAAAKIRRRITYTLRLAGEKVYNRFIKVILLSTFRRK